MLEPLATPHTSYRINPKNERLFGYNYDEIIPESVVNLEDALKPYRPAEQPSKGNTLTDMFRR